MIDLINLSKQFGGQTLLEEASLKVSPGEKLGLVGRNGSGKSTLIRMILGLESLEEGVISLPKNYLIGHVAQHLKFERDNILDEVAQNLAEEEQFDLYKAEKILFGLGFKEGDLGRAPREFSGGMQVRINLAKCLVRSPQMLLLDEPTNYLDILSVRWLKSFLKSYPGELILVTHDRDFMDEIVTHVAGIMRKKIKKIPGNTQKFYQQLALEDEIYLKSKVNQEKKKEQLEKFVEKFKAKASKATQAQSKLKQIERMGTMEDLENEDIMQFRFPYKDFNAKSFLSLEGISFAYPGGVKILENFSLKVSHGDKIGIIGKNGQGKSTLLNLIAGELQLDGGHIDFHPDVKIGHFGQTNVNRLDVDKTIVEEVQTANVDLSHTAVRSICGTVLFSGDMAEKKIKVLSGGERARVLLAKLLACESNLLLLDEPTHHLDMESIDSLKHSISTFPGTTIIVSHDEGLLKDVADRLIVFDNGQTLLFEDNYQEFLNQIGWHDEGGVKKKKKKGENGKHQRKKSKDKQKEIKAKQNELKSLEAIIPQQEAQIKQYHQRLVELSTCPEPIEMARITQALEQLEQELEENFEKLCRLEESLSQ